MTLKQHELPHSAGDSWKLEHLHVLVYIRTRVSAALLHPPESGAMDLIRL